MVRRGAHAGGCHYNRWSLGKMFRTTGASSRWEPDMIRGPTRNFRTTRRRAVPATTLVRASTSRRQPQLTTTD
ncbi:Uncharacterised protein [Mycobacteroides abscessus subsp. abscessus]|nr:Uncharacterised protein [Mycobacteroides abscessus subsp. abscessus]